MNPESARSTPRVFSCMNRIEKNLQKKTIVFVSSLAILTAAPFTCGVRAFVACQWPFYIPLKCGT